MMGLIYQYDTPYLAVEDEVCYCLPGAFTCLYRGNMNTESEGERKQIIGPFREFPGGAMTGCKTFLSVFVITI